MVVLEWIFLWLVQQHQLGRPWQERLYVSLADRTERLEIYAEMMLAMTGLYNGGPENINTIKEIRSVTMNIFRFFFF